MTSFAAFGLPSLIGACANDPLSYEIIDLSYGQVFSCDAMGSLRKCVLAFLLCGSLNTIARKTLGSQPESAAWDLLKGIAYSMFGTADDHAERFQKPWFATFVMFVAMASVLPFDAGNFACWSCSPGGCQALCLNCQSSLRFNAETPTTARPPIECHGTMCGEQGD
ncbi:unnamed protein product [Effrenium voratum]|nr:unnamed protein product [Effrenium voratum]